LIAYAGVAGATSVAGASLEAGVLSAEAYRLTICFEIDAGGVLEHGHGLHEVVGDLLGQRPAPSVEMTVSWSMAAIGEAISRATLGSTSTSICRTAASLYAGERGGTLVHRLGLGLPGGQDRRRLRLTLGAQWRRPRRCAGPSRPHRGAAPSMASASARAVRRAFSASPVSRAFSASACGAAIAAALRASASAIAALRAGLGLLLDPVARRVGGLAHFGVELTLLQRGLPDGDLLLLGEDRLVTVGLGQRTRPRRLERQRRRSRP
jgi:hypothetical protein